jgi:hypothetical protein
VPITAISTAKTTLFLYDWKAITSIGFWPFSAAACRDEIPLQCGLRLKLCFADNILSLKSG